MAHKHEQNTLSSITVYLLTKFYEKFSGLATAIIRPMLLAPDAYGLFTILKIIPYYASYLNLGSYDIIRYRIPYHEVRDEEEKITEISSTVFFGTLFLNLSAFVCVIGIVLFIRPRLPIAIGILAMASISLVNWYYDNLVITLKGRQKFFRLSKTLVVKSTIALIANLTLIYLFKLYGLYGAMFLSTLVGIIHVKRHYPISFKKYFDRRLFFEILKAGFPIMIFNFCTVLVTTADRIIITYFLGTKELGYYGIGIMVMGFLIQIPVSSREVMEPRLMQQNSETSKQNMEAFFVKPLMNVSLLVSLLIGGAIFLLPILVTLLLPKYLPGILPGQILVLGSYFLTLTYITRGIIIYHAWQKKASIVTLATLFVNVLLNIWAIKLGLGLLGIAVASAITYFVMFLALLVFIWHYETDSALKLKKTLFIILWPFVILLPIAVLCQWFSSLSKTKSLIIASNLGGIVLFASMLLLGIFIMRRMKIDLGFNEIPLKKVVLTRLGTKK